MPSLLGGSLEIPRTVPLKDIFKHKVQIDMSLNMRFWSLLICHPSWSNPGTLNKRKEPFSLGNASLFIKKKIYRWHHFAYQELGVKEVKNVPKKVFIMGFLLPKHICL